MTLMSAQIHFVVSNIVDGRSLERMVRTSAMLSNVPKDKTPPQTNTVIAAG